MIHALKIKLIKEALFDYFAPKIANARSIKEMMEWQDGGKATAICRMVPDIYT